MNTRRLIIFVSAFVATVHAGPRASMSYSVLTETTDVAGRRSTSANYTHDASMGGIAGIAAASPSAQTAKSGYIGQLFEVTGLQLAASSTTVNEGTTRQLGGVQLLDDLTVNAVPAASIAWSIQSGAVSIDSNGLATAATVYQNTPATVQGIFAGNTGTLNLTVMNVNTDDLPGYSGDGLADDWQVQYFGQNNPDAKPMLDPDGDGQNNLFEFTAGLSPTSRSSRFVLNTTALAGQMKIIISPRLNDRTYAVEYSTTLQSAGWNVLSTFTTEDAGQQRTITDTNATGGRKFYRVLITKP